MLRAAFRASCRIRTNDPEITNHVLWPTELKRQKGRATYIAPLRPNTLASVKTWGIQGSWSWRTHPECKVTTKIALTQELKAKKFYILNIFNI